MSVKSQGKIAKENENLDTKSLRLRSKQIHDRIDNEEPMCKYAIVERLFPALRFLRTERLEPGGI